MISTPELSYFYNWIKVTTFEHFYASPLPRPTPISKEELYISLHMLVGRYVGLLQLLQPITEKETNAMAIDFKIVYTYSHQYVLDCNCSAGQWSKVKAIFDFVTARGGLVFHRHLLHKVMTKVIYFSEVGQISRSS